MGDRRFIQTTNATKKKSFLGVVLNVDPDFEGGPRGPKPHLDTVLDQTCHTTWAPPLSHFDFQPGRRHNDQRQL